jgi:hypothetical protein
MTTITIERALLEQAYAMLSSNKTHIRVVMSRDETCVAIRAALAAPAAAPEQPASKALQDVATERQRQDAKWGGPEHDDTHPISDWQRFISQRAENLVYRGNPERMYELFIEIAALAVAAAESIDRKGTP